MVSDGFDSIYELPVNSRKNEILEAVDANQVTIITAETGAGKSTQIPQFLAEHGYNKIIVTQPRILAARNLSDRVRQEYSYRLGVDATNLVGYRTAHERDDGPENVILYCTDGLQLVREITGSGTTDRQILVLDEVHEWNENMEVLIAWAKKRCLQEPDFKIVLMSATIESASLAAYFEAPAPIAIEGRSYPVERRHQLDLIATIVEMAESSVSNMLVFLPGKAEIEKVAEALKLSISGDIPILPLHSQLEPEVQQAVFEHYPHGKIILSTNIAQTSVTIDDIDVVIDSGLERRAEVRSGVEGLFIEETSQADCLQRAGRAGRTKPGIYVLAQLGTLPCSPEVERSEYGIPEILRKHIDRVVLRLAAIGIDIEELDFFHRPSRKAIKNAKATLISLGALTNDRRITAIGRSMEKFPVESSYARMLVEANQYDVSVQRKLAAIIAIQEVGGIIRGGPRYSGWRAYTKQVASDLIAQYDVFLASRAIDESELEQLGIIPKNLDKTDEILNRLLTDLGLADEPCEPVTEVDETAILRCIISGQLHQIWSKQDNGKLINIMSGSEREVSSSSIVKNAPLVAGTPFDLQVPTGDGLQTLKLVNDLTAVDPAWLAAVAPDDFSLTAGKLFYSPEYGTLAYRTQLIYRDRAIDIATAPLLDRRDVSAKRFAELYAVWAHNVLDKERRSLQSVNKRRIPEVPLHQLQKQVMHIADGSIALFDMSKQQKIELSKLTKLDTHLPGKLLASLRTPTERHHSRFKHPFKPKFRQNDARRRHDHRRED